MGEPLYLEGHTDRVNNMDPKYFLRQTYSYINESKVILEKHFLHFLGKYLNYRKTHFVEWIIEQLLLQRYQKKRNEKGCDILKSF